MPDQKDRPSDDRSTSRSDKGTAILRLTATGRLQPVAPGRFRPGTVSRQAGEAPARRVAIFRAFLKRSSAHPGEAVGTPVFAANAMMGEEQAIAIVFLLDGEQPVVVRSPE